MFEMCLKLTIKTLEQCQWRSSAVFIASFELILHDALVFIWLTLSNQMPAVKDVVKEMQVKLMSKKVEHYQTKEQVTIIMQAQHCREIFLYSY